MKRPVSIHYCLSGANRGKWSVVDRQRGSSTYGRVVSHQSRAVLHGAEFRVSEKRRQAVITKRCREVHARIWGLCDLSEQGDPTATSAHYNPYRAPTFTTRDGQPVHTADTVVFADNGRCYI